MTKVSRMLNMCCALHLIVETLKEKGKNGGSKVRSAVETWQTQALEAVGCFLAWNGQEMNLKELFWKYMS